MSEIIFVPGKRKYLFCGNQEGMKLLFDMIERVKEEGQTCEIYLIEGIQERLQLFEILKKQKMGTYLYVALPYDELENVKKAAEETGFTDEEAQYIGYSERTIRIFCCRCHSINQTTAVKAEVVCNQCGLELSVSDHYSKTHNAYLGYVANL